MSMSKNIFSPHMHTPCWTPPPNTHVIPVMNFVARVRGSSLYYRTSTYLPRTRHRALALSTGEMDARLGQDKGLPPRAGEAIPT